MNKAGETVIKKINTFPIIALLLVNLLAVLLTMGILLVRTKSLVGSGSNISVDRIGEIKLDQGNITFDLMNLDPATNTPKVIQQVSMKDQDFLTGFSKMEELVKKMIAAGLIKSRAQGGVAPDAAPSE